jgi:hypothetical protein
MHTNGRGGLNREIGLPVFAPIHLKAGWRISGVEGTRIEALVVPGIEIALCGLRRDSIETPDPGDAGDEEIRAWIGFEFVAALVIGSTAPSPHKAHMVVHPTPAERNHVYVLQRVSEFIADCPGYGGPGPDNEGDSLISAARPKVNPDISAIRKITISNGFAECDSLQTVHTFRKIVPGEPAIRSGYDARQLGLRTFTGRDGHARKRISSHAVDHLSGQRKALTRLRSRGEGNYKQKEKPASQHASTSSRKG